MAEKHIHSGHRQRMKQRFLNYPAEFMYDHELLEIALYYTRPVVNTNDTAHDLISANGSLSKVLGLPVSELEKVKGIGSGSALFIKILHEGILRYLAHSCENTVLSSVSDIKAMFEDYFRGSDTELCCITTISPSMSLMNTICLPYSDVADNSISQRELAELLITHNTYRMMIGLYRPYAQSTPMPSDMAITHLFSELSVPLGIELIDCVVCGISGSFSMREKAAFSFGR